VPENGSQGGCPSERGYDAARRTPAPFLKFFVRGEPAAQGSKTPWGTEANPNLKPWREAVIWEARAAAAGAKLEGPVLLRLQFVYRRPKAHYRAGRYAGEVKASAPLWKSSTPDLDKLCRAVGDALTQSGVLRDDALVAILEAAKLYGEEPGLTVELRPV